MDLSNLFKAHLIEKGSSVPTVKNYVADVRKFVCWYELTYKTLFSPSLVTAEVIEAYKSALKKNPSSSVDRYLSSLRKFFVFVKEQNLITSSPFEIGNLKLEVHADPLHIRAFKNSLLEEKAGELTVKNYVLDVNQFTQWAESVTKRSDDHYVVTQHDLFPHLTSELIEEYKNRLLLDMKLSPSSVNRKLSSIRKYFAFLIKQEVIRTAPYVLNSSLHGTISRGADEPKSNLDTTQPLSTEEVKKNEEVDSRLHGNDSTEIAPLAGYSAFPPLRLVQKLGSLINLVFDLLIIVPLVKILENGQVILWKLSGKKLFTAPFEQTRLGATLLSKLPVKALAETLVRGEIASADRQGRKGSLSHFIKTGNWGIQNVSKAFYAPLSISVKELPMHKQIIHHLKHTRPTWYKKYHSLAISHYIHFAILMIFITGLGAGMYTVLFTDASKNKTLAALPTAPPRILSFQGRLTDNSDNPITATKQVRFSIYDDITASGSGNLLWQEVQGVTPDVDGIFSVLMGNTVTSCVNPLTPATGQCLIPSTLFADNATLYLGITIENDTELGPRQQIATVAYAANSETLQGLPPSTAGGAGTSNVVLALDSSGNLTIGGSATPTFQASGGQFTLSGTVLNLTTTAGTNSNIQFTPDGLGKIDVQKAFVNSTNNSPILSAAGSVSVDDLFSVNATSSGQSAFTLNQDGAGPIISASASGVARFTVENNGSGYFAGNVGIGTTIPTSYKLSVNGDVYTSQNLSVDGGAGAMTLTGNNISINPGRLWQINTTASLFSLHDGSAGATRLAIDTNGNIGIGTTVPSNFKLEVAGSVGPTVDATYDLGSPTKRWNNIYAANIVGGTSGTQGFWQLNSGAISPANSTNDLLLGATATTSAKFAFINNIGSGTPTASISAGTAGALYTAANGTIATTAKQNLLLGNSGAITTSGNVLLNPNGTGNVGVGTTNPGTSFEVGTSTITSRPTSGTATINSNNAGGNTLVISNGGTDPLTSIVGSGITFKAATYGTTTSWSTGRILSYFDTSGGSNPGYGGGILAFQYPTADNTFTTGMVLRNGNIGIGTTVPSNKLTVGGAIDFSATGSFVGSGTGIFSPATNEFSIVTAGNNRVRVDASGNVGIGTTATTSKLQVNGNTALGYATSTTAPTNGLAVAGNVGIGTTTATEALEIVGDFKQTNTRTRTMTRTIPTVVNDVVDIGSFVFNAGAASLTVSITVGSGGYSVSKEYLLPIQYSQTAGTWTVALPTSSTGSYSSQDFALDVNVNAATTSLRIRRTLGATAGTAWIVIRQDGLNSDVFTASTATSSVAAPTTYFGSTALTQVTGNVGIGTLAPAYKLDVSGGSGIVGQFSGRVIGGNAVNSNEFATLGQITGGLGNLWQLNSNALSPVNSSYDVLVGATATASAIVKLPANTNRDAFFNLGTGNLGIGTTAPVTKVAIVGTRSVLIDTETIGAWSGIGFQSTFSASNYALLGSATDTILGRPSGGALRFREANGADQMTIISGGNVGINSTSPQAKLDVQGVDSVIRFGLNTGFQNGYLGISGRLNSGNILFGRNLTGVSGSDSFQTPGTGGWGYSGIEQLIGGDISFYAQDGNTTAASTVTPVSRITIKGSTGNVGIGTTTVNSKLHVTGSTTGNSLVTFNQTTSGAPILTASAAGTPRFVVQYDGNVGIGTSLPASKLSVVGTSTAAGGVGVLSLTGGIELRLGSDASHAWIQSFSSQPLSLNPLGNNVGIGTTTPTAKLDVAGDASASGSLVLRGSTNYIESLNGGSLNFQTSVGGDAGLTNRMTILNNGNVGIGSTTPGFRLDIGSTSGNGVRSGRYEIDGPNGIGEIIASGNDLRLRSTTANVIIDAASGSNIELGTAFGNVGIGSTTPTAKLDVTGDASTSGSLVFNGSNKSIDVLNGSTLNFATSVGGDAGLTNRMTILNNGNVGIGTTTPGEKLHISGGQFLLDYTGSNAFRIRDNSFNTIFKVDSSSSRVGIGTTTPGYTFDVQGGSGIVGQFSGRVIGADAVNSNEFATLGQIAGGAGQYWQLNSGALSPSNSTNDVLFGGTATTSARFAFINNIGAGVPTASVSAGTNGALYFAANGVISTTAKQNLLLGNNGAITSTGNILLNGNGTGNVGIGTTNPGYKLDVVGGVGVGARIGKLILTDDAPFYTGANINAGANQLGIGTSGSAVVGFFTNNSERMRIDTAGNVGIGTTSVGSKLQVNGGAAIGYSTSTAAPTNGLAVSGNVGIGTTTASRALTVSGDILGTQTAYLVNGQQTYYAETYLVPTATNTNINLTAGTNTLAGGMQYRVLLTTTGTGTSTGAVYIVYQTAVGTWTSRLVSANSTLSNSPLLGVSGTNVYVYHNHASSYNIKAQVYGIDSGNTSLTASTYFGLEGEMTNLSGNIGIGTTAPTYKLDVQGGLGVLGGAASVFQGAVSLGNGNDNVDVNGTDLFINGTSGNVGIGTNTPSQLFHVNGGSGIVGQFSGRVIGGDAVNSNEFATLGQVSSATYWQRALGALAPENITDDVLVGGSATASAKIRLGGTTNANSYFNTGGNLGIGTTVPVGVLHASISNSAAPVALFERTTASTGSFGINFNSGLSSLESVNAIRFTTGATAGAGGTERMRIDTTGNVGIGSTTPGSLLDLSGGVGRQNGYTLAAAGEDSLIVNGDFEQGSYGWTSSAPANMTTVSGGYSGNNALQITGAALLNSNDYIPVDPVNDVIQLEAYLKKSTAGTTPGVMYFGYYAYNASKVLITTSPCGTYCYFAASGAVIPADGNWHKYSATTTGEGASYPNFPVGTKYIRILGLINYSASSDSVTQIDHISLRRINNGPLFVGNNFSSTNLVDQTQMTKLYTTATNQFIITPPSSGNVGIGTTTTPATLSVNGTGYYSGNVGIGTTTLSGASLSVIGGSVGIGTTAPAASLEVSKASTYSSEGTAGISILGGTTDTKLILGADAANDVSYIQSMQQGTSYSNRVLALQPNGGYVGIGTTATTSKLQVNGSTAIGYSTSTAAPTNGLAVSGNVGIGTTTASRALTVTGDILGTQTAYIANGQQTYYAETYSVPTATNTNINLTAGNSTLSSGMQYRVVLSTTGTSTNTGAVYIVYQTAVGTWTSRLVSANGNTSNHPLLGVSGTNVYVYHNHASTYNIRAQVYGLDSGNATNTATTYFGLEGELTNLIGNIGVGTTAPAYKFDVVGGAGVVGQFSGRVIGGNAVNSNEFATLGQITGGLGNLWQLNAGSLSPSNSTYDVLVGANATASALIKLGGTANASSFFNTGGNVGIGTTGSVEKLQVAGNIRLPSSDNYIAFGSSAMRIQASNSGGNLDFAGGTQTNAFRFWSNNMASVLAVINDNGNVGIGTTTVNSKLEVKGSTTGNALVTFNNTTSNGDLFTASSSGTTKFIIANNGNTTISSTGGAGANALVLNTSNQTNSNSAIRWTGSAGTAQAGIGTYFNAADVGNLEFLNGSTTNMLLTSTGNLGIGTTDVGSKLQVNGGAAIGYSTSTAAPANGLAVSGNVGIGTTTVSAKLHSLATTEQLRLGYDASNYASFTVGSNSSLSISTSTGTGDITINPNGNLNLGTAGTDALFLGRTDANIPVVFNTLGGEAMRFTNGNLGIGTTAPTNRIQVSGSTTGNALVGLNQTTAGADILTGSASGTTKFVFNSNGNLGIGSSLPAYALDVNAGSGIVGQFSGRVIGGSAVNSNEFITLSQLTSATYWQRLLGALSPANITDDLLLGGTSTASAKFAFINNIGSGSPTATISGNLSLVVPTGSAPANTFNLLNGGSLNFQSALTGQGDAALTSRLFIKNDGNIGIGVTSPSSALAVNGVNSEIRAGITTSTGQFGVIGVTRRANYGDIMFSRNLEGVSGSDNYQTIGTLASTGYNGIEFKYGGDTYFYSQDGNTTAATTVSPVSRLTIKGDTGNVGIGTTTPFGKLNVVGAAATPIGKSALVVIQNETSQDLFTASAGATTRFVIKNDGNVGIGTSLPTAKLEIVGTSGTNLLNLIGGAGGAAESAYLSVQSRARFGYNGSGILIDDGNTSKTFKITLGGGDRLYIHPLTGNVGIGTTNPIGKLNVVGESAYATGKAALVIIQNETSGDIFTASAGATTRFVINNAGNVGIGTSLPSGTLDITSGSDTYAKINTSSSGSQSVLGLYNQNNRKWLIYNQPANHDLYFANSSTQVMTLQQSSGNVGIGTTTPTAKLDVAGDASTSGSLVFNGSNKSVDVLNGSSLSFATSVGGDAGLATKLTLLNNGNFGIGSTSPAYLFDVSGGSGIVGQFSGRVIGADAVNSNEFATLGQVSSATYWQRALGALAPENITDDVLVGGSATASAKIRLGGTTNADSFFNTGGNVGIGNSAPGTKLHVTGTITATTNVYSPQFNYDGGVTFMNGTSGALNITNVINGAIIFRTTNTERARIDGTGNLGIGTTTPFGRLNVVGESANPIGKAALVIIQNETNGDLFTASAGATTRFVIKNDGNVGIGTSLPTSDLHIYGRSADTQTVSKIEHNSGSAGQAVLSLGSTGSGGRTYTITSADAGYANGNGLLFEQGDGLSVKFMNTGNVGIGTTAPTAKLDVAGDASTSGSLVFNGSNKSVDVLNGSSLSFATSVGGDAGLATKLTLLNNGNFGIGSTAPAYLFDVSGGSGIVGQFSGRVIGGDAVNSNEFATLGQVSSSAYWQRALGALSPTNITDDVLLGATATASALVKLGGTTNATSYFNTGGNVGIGTTNPSLFKLQVTGDIGPTTNNTYDLGSSGSIWNDLYVQTARPNAILANGATGSDSIYELAGGNILLDNAKGLRFKDSGGTGFSALSVTGANNVQLNTPAASGSLQFSVANSSGIIQFLTNGSERARFDNNGNLGIGTTSPLGRLNVVGTSAAPIGKAALAIIQNETSQDLFTASAGATTRFVIKNDGNVGIGSTAPAQMLDVTGSALFSGNVGIGTTTVSDKLNINGNIRFTNATSNTIFYGTAGVAAPGAASAGQKIQLYGTAGTVGAGDYALGIESGNLWMNSGGGFKWYASSTEKMRMDANGNLGIGTTTTSPAKLSVAGHVSIEGTTKESFSGQETRTYRNLAQFRIDSPTQTGTVKIALPTAKNNSLTMMTVRITGYSYIDNGGAWEAIVSGYNYSSGWINTSAEIRGSAPFTSVRMGTDGTADVILLGTTASVWEYPQIFINEVNVGYTSEDGFEGPWTITMITDETGITVEKTPLIKMYAATNGNIGIGTVTPGSKLDIDTGSNALGLRLRGTAETVEIADMYVAASGALTLSTVAGSGTSGYIDLRGEDDQYGLILRDSAGVTPTTYANFYMNDAATDYLNITANATNATAGLIVQTGGNIGIGSTAPTQRLDTIGGFKLGNNSGTGQIDTTDWDISTTGALTGISGITTDGGYTQSGSTGNVFTGNVGVGTGATSTLGTLTLTGGDTGAGFTDAAIAFGYANTTNYAHFIHTRHNAGASASNAIDFYTSDGTAAGVYPTNAVHGLSINGGNVGVGSTNPGYKFDVQGGSGIVGNFSGRVIGASAVNSNEFITLSQLTSATYWQRLLGALSPTNITDDVLVGGTATASALIKLPGQNNQDAFFNLGTGNVGIGTTTTTDKLTVNGNANLLTGFGYEINGASVLSATTLGTGVLTSSLTTVGALNAGSITSGFGTIDTGADAITTSGTIGTAATTTFTGATGTFATSVTTPVVDNAAGLSIGATSATSLTLGRSGVTTTFGSTAWTATPTISGLITATSGLTANGALTANAAFTLGDNGDLGSVNTSSWDISTAGAFTGVTTLNMSGQLTSSLSTGTAPFVVASTTKVTNLNADLLDGIDSTGFCQTDGTGCSSAQFWQRNLGALSPKNITDDVLLGATATASATVRFGAITNANSYINTGGNLGIGTTTPGQKLDVNGSILAGANSTFDVRAAGTLAIGTATQTGITVGRTGAATTINGNASSAIDFGNFDVNATGEITAATNETINGIDISAGAISDVTTFASTYLTTTTNTVNLSGASTILQMNGTTVIDASRNLLNIGTTQFNTVTYTWPGANGAAGTVLTNNGSGTLSWSAAASGSLWTITNGIIHPNNSTLDLAIGGTATTSAAFSFINSNSTSNATPPTFRGYDATRTNYVSLNHDGTNANLSASTGTINIGAGGGTLYVTTDIINDTTSNSNGFVKIADKLLVQGTENSSTGFGNALAVIDNLGTGDILTGSASGTPKFVFNNSGNLGIGTTRPASALAVGSTSQFAVTSAGAISAATGITSSGAITFSAFTSNGGVLYTNGSGVVSQVTAGTGAQCLLGGTTPSFGTCGATVWSSIGNPAGNLSLTMGTNLTTFNWATGTSTNNLFNLTTDASSNGTGALMNIATGTSSTVLPLQVKAGSINSILVNAAGNVGIGTTTPFGKLNINNSAQASLNPLGKALAIFQQYETNGDILAASASGTTVFKLANDGTITASALYDVNDSSFYVDPANATLSLSTAGNLLANAGSVISPYGGFGRYENYLTNSETLGSWTASGVTVTSDAVAGPDGQTTADQITDAVGAGTTLTQTYTAAITTGSSWTFSVWLKNNTATGTVIIKIADSTGATQSLSIDPTTISSWKRYSVTMTAGTSPTSVTATIDANQANSGRNLYAWGAQLEKQSNSGVYATTSSTNITTTGRGLIAESAGPHLFLSGNVGLGTTTAGQLLTLAGNQKIVSTNDASIGIAKTGGNGAGLIAVNGSQLGINFDSNGKFVIGQSSRGNIDANTYSGTDLVTVLANGNVGIGTTTIGAKLHIVGVANSSSTPASWAQNIILDTTSGTNNVTEFRVAGTRKGSIRIDSSGNAVFQGASTGGTYLAWDEGSGGVHFGNGSATEIGSISNAGALVMSGTGTFGTNALISGSGVSYFNGGNVGIGTTTSGTYKLTVNGGIQSLDYGAAGTANIIVGDDAFLTDLDTANTMALYGVSNNTIGILQLGSNSGAAITGNAGNIGIGTTTMNRRFVALGSTNGGTPHSIINADTTDSTGTGVILLGTGTSTSGTNSRFIKFYAGITSDSSFASGGTGVGRVRLNGTGVAYETGAADFAEYLDMGEDAENGDIIAITTNKGMRAVKGNGLVGVVSDTAGFVGNAKSEEPTANQRIVGLLGQISTKVSNVNGPISRGDVITSSDIPGVGQRATGAGYVIGKALEDFNPQSSEIIACPAGTEQGVVCGKIRLYVSPSWYDPEVFITDAGVLNISGTNGTYTATNNGTLVSRIGSFAQAVIATLRVGALNAREITTNSLALTTSNMTIAGQSLNDYIIAVVTNAGLGGNSNSPEIKTNLISPLSGDELALDANVKIKAKDAAKPALSVEGNASISGELRAKSLETDDATVSGTLRAGRIIADDIEGLNARIARLDVAEARLASLSANNITATSAAITNITNVTNVYNTASESATPGSDASGSATLQNMIPSLTADFIQTQYADIASLSAGIGFVPNLSSDFMTVNQGLVALGPTSLSDTAIAGQLSVNGSLILAENSVNVLGANFEIQPLRQGGVSFLSGLITFDTDGNVRVSGNADFQQNVTVGGTLATSFISPLPGNDLNIILPAGTNGQGSKLAVRNASGSAVFQLNQLGDVIASGAGTFKDIAANSFNIVRGAQADTSTIETVASGSAGTAVVKAYQTERTIISPFVSEKSLIYITATSDTQGVTPYVARQIAEDKENGIKGSFTIEVPSSVTSDIKINWWIVN